MRAGRWRAWCCPASPTRPGGQRLTRLLVSTRPGGGGEETGGPLVNLSGEAIEINVARTGSGLRHTGFAVPIDTALAVAERIQAAHSP